MKLDKRIIFTTVACAGVVATGVASANGATKAEKLKAGLKEPSKMDLVKLYFKSYWLAGLLGAGTVASIIASHKLSSKQIAALTATAAYLTYNRDSLEHKLKEAVGEEKLQEIKHVIEQQYAETEAARAYPDSPNKSPTIEVSKYGGDTLFLDGYSGRLFYCTKKLVEEAEEELSRRFTEDHEYLCFNDFYKLLGIQKTQFGDQYGWPANEDWYDLNNGIIFNNWFLSDGTEAHDGPLYVIEFFDHNSYPIECWKEL